MKSDLAATTTTTRAAVLNHAGDADCRVLLRRNNDQYADDVCVVNCNNRQATVDASAACRTSPLTPESTHSRFYLAACVINVTLSFPGNLGRNAILM